MTKHTATPSHALPKLKPLVASLFTWVQRPGTLALTLGAMPALALANMPAGGKVVAGAATISNPDGNHTIINQTSDKAVLNWQSFSIGEGGYVQFVQRDANSVALNRVVGSDPSAILGNLSANGQIFLVNQNGIFFGHSAKVDVAGIVATTLDIKDEDFMRGDYRFSRGANAPARATVINEGALNANGGYVVLAGDYAANKGIVQAQLGTVLLASGDSLTLQMAGSSLINYQVDKATVAHLAGVENSGQILANGGRVIMTADVAQDLASTVVNNSGLIQAQSAVEKNGAIYFEGNGGNVANSGTLDASAQAGANGGHVEIRASGDIAHEAGSKIDVSGAAAGVSDAGSVNTWADGTNRYKEGASIAARGGAQGGNGGDVELSGNNVVNRSIVDLSAANGQLGTLTLDPLAITVADGAGTNTEDGATIYEQNLEAQLKVGNVSLLATGQDASITVGALSDGVLDGSNNGSGGSLSLRAEGSGNPAVRFADKTNTIKVDKAISISTGDLEAPASGTIDVGHLQAGTGIALDSGSIKAASLSVQKTIATPGDTSYAINARATNGGITVDGDVKLDVTNTAAGALSTTVSLRADNGDVNVGGAVTSNATGLGYYHYNWTTAGNDATTYYGEQPWSLVGQGDHPILANLNIQASGSVRAGAVNVLATDKNIAFDTTPGGYWQTATATQHNFWRATGAKAAASVSAGADVAVGGNVNVKADGYATASYGETESWRTMVDNFNYTSGSQTVVTTRSDGNGGTTQTSTTNNYNNLKGSMKGAGSDRYIWKFGPYTIINGGTVQDYSRIDTRTDSSGSSASTAMSYAGVSGMSATLSVNATGSVAMNGMEVRSTNRSASGNGTFTDANWGRQDTAANLNGTGDSFTSAQQEIDYSNDFSTRYTAATSTATANISAGDNASVTIGNGNGVNNVVAEHTKLNAAANNLAGATLAITAGSNSGATGSGLVSIAGGLNVSGASGSDVSLNIRNYDGGVVLSEAGTSVTNAYNGADGRATVQSDSAAVQMDGIAVSGGRSAWLDVNGATITVDKASSATATAPNSVGTARIRMNAAGDISTGDILATSDKNLVTRVSEYYNNGYDYTVDGGAAAIDVRSAAGSLDLRGDVKASGNKTADVNLNAYGAGATLRTAAGKTVSANANGATYTSTGYQRYLSVPTYSANTTLGSNGAMTLGSSVEATLTNRNGAASVYLGTTGGIDAAISQAAGARILADGSSGSVVLQAGSGAAYGAAIDLQGSIAAQGSTGSALLNVTAASGLVHDFGASSRDSNASVTVNARDAAGKLTVDGAGAISGNGNAYNSAALAVNAAGALDAGAMNATVANVSTGASAGATANLGSANGDLQLGSLAVSGAKTATAMAISSGNLDAFGNVTASANAASGNALVSLNAGDAMDLDATASAAATANGNLGNASVNLSAASGMTLDGDLGATAAGNGQANIVANTVAAGSVLAQGADSVISANGAQSGSISLTAGSANNGAFDLQGDLRARASSGAAGIVVNGTSGTVHDFSAVSTGAVATASINALDGDLALTGDASLAGFNGATLNAAASRALDVSGNLAASTSGVNALAQVNLNALGGTLAVQAGASAAASATGNAGRADLNVASTGAMTANGDLRANSLSGEASVDLVTLGGTAAGITQGASSTIAASGSRGTVGINAGDTAPNGATGAAYALAGDIQARGTLGTAAIAVNGSGGSVHDFSAQSANGNATVALRALAPAGALALDGTGSVRANVNAVSGALLNASAASLDTGAASLAVTNLSAGATASARADLGGAALTLGDIAVGGNAAILNAAADNGLAVTGALSTVATGANGAAQTIVAAQGVLTVDAGASVAASASRNLQAGLASATVTVSGAQGVTLDGNLNASAGGYAGIDVAAANGSLALNADQTAAADRSASIANRAMNGGLTQAAGSTLHSSALDGGADIALNSLDAMQIAGKLTAAATADGSAGGIHTGSATIGIATTGGALANITQDVGSTIEAIGQAARLSVNAGSAFPAGDIANAAAFSLNGSLRAIDDIGGSSLDIAGAAGNVHDFTVAAANASANATITALSGDLVLDGAGSVSANGSATLLAEAAGALDARNATIAVASTGNDGMDYADASLAAYGGDIRLGQAAVSANGGTAGLYASASGALAVSGNASARSTASDATVDLSTTGGVASTITQDGGTAIVADGASGAVRFHAGNMKYGNYAAVTLDGDVQAHATTGSAELVISGASMTLNDFSAASTGGSAFVAIETLAADGHVVMNGNGSASGATSAELNATSSGNIAVNGRQSVYASGANGDARVVLDAAGSASVAAGGVVNVTGASASMDIDADSSIGITGSLNAVGNNAGIDLQAASGNVVLDGNLATQGGERGAISVRAQDGSLTQAGTLRSSASAGVAQVDLSSKGTMTINGQVSAAATLDGTVDGAHTGAALVGLATNGGADATLVQSAGSTIAAVGRSARLDVKAGSSSPFESTSRTAAFELDGTLRVIDAIGGSSLDIAGASGRVHDFSVGAADSTASANIAAVNGNLVLNGAGTVAGNSNRGTGASLNVSASGTLDTSAAMLAVTNASNGDSAGAQAVLQAGASAVLGRVDVNSARASVLDVTANGRIDTTTVLASTASGVGGNAGVSLAAGGLAHVAANGSVHAGAANGAAKLAVSGNAGVNLDGQLDANGAEAHIDVASAAGAIALNANVNALASQQAGIDVHAQDGTLTQAAGTTIAAGATFGAAEVDLSSSGALSVNGKVLAAATADGTAGGAHTGAALIGITTTGGAASGISQSQASSIEAVGRAARLAINAGSAHFGDDAGADVAKAAAFKLDGTLRAIDDIGGSTLEIVGASGSVHDFTVAAANSNAKASITAVGGNLAFNGKGEVTGNAERTTGASLLVKAAGNVDTTAATLTVSNANASRETGAAAVLQAGGNLAVGPVSVTGANAALNAGAAGKLDVLNTLATSGTSSAGIQLLGGQGVTLGAALNASADQAYIAVTAASGNVALNSAVTALGGDRASVAVQALDGSLTQAAGTTITAGATSGVAEVDLSSSGALAINGKILAAATADGTADGAHTGAALIGITTTGGAASGISQSQASSIEAVGRAARLAINAGSAHFGDDAGADVTKAAAFKLDGTLRAIDAIGGSSLQIAGASGSVHDFTVAAADATAHADIAAVNGDLVLSGTGSVSGNANALDGASLKLSASGSLDTTGTTLKVVNVNSGDEAGAQAVLLASTGAAKLGVAKVTAQGGGTAVFQATAGTTLVATAKLDAENLGMGTAAGNALVKLNTTGKTGVTSTITQDSGATITAATKGNAGNATVDIQAGNCCNSAVALNDTVKAVVDGGTGSATIAARGATVTVKDLTANVLAAGTGNTMVSLAAPTEVKLAGTIDSQAASSTARAQVQLVSDKLTDGASFKLSKGNGHVQLTPFSTGKIIGVHSDKDFDETADVNYNLVTLKKFMTQGAELSFGGEFDRSAWIDPVTGEVCLPGMEAWASQLQHTGAIHVAGNGRLNLGDVKMVFDTTGTTTYHDPKMSAWSVPTGRVATLVVPPSNVDRYLDRTDNTVQNMNKVVQDTTATTRSSGAVEAGQPVPRGTQIAGKLFMDGNGVNMARNDAAEGSQADAQGPESKSRQHGDSTEQ
ncbi:MAG: filamentous hemagglutinin N-terminal domain-containing protein [Pseudomonadota bacterium]